LFHAAGKDSHASAPSSSTAIFISGDSLPGLKAVPAPDTDLRKTRHQFRVRWVCRAELQHKALKKSNEVFCVSGVSGDEIDVQQGLRYGCAKDRRQRTNLVSHPEAGSCPSGRLSAIGFEFA
jgi:hypothetical protein